MIKKENEKSVIKKVEKQKWQHINEKKKVIKKRIMVRLDQK